MDNTTLLIIIVALLLIGGGWYGRGRGTKLGIHLYRPHGVTHAVGA
jgi:hypothetical protein